MESKTQCALCTRRRSVFYCPRCTSDMLQQRRTMLAALQADVAVLRKKTEFALNSKSSLVDAEKRLDGCMKKVEVLADKVMKTRERLCNERIAVVEETSKLEEQSERLEVGQLQLQSELQRSRGFHASLLDCLDFQVQWANENAARIRGEKIRELFAFFRLTPAPEEGEEGEEEHESQKKSRPSRVFFRTITSLPLPVSGRYEAMPPEVVAAALGKVIHLLICLVKYLKITYPHPMVFNGSFSTIGNTSEGAGCHTLYPDGSIGFDRGVIMLHENIAFLTRSQQQQGVPGHESPLLHPTDVLGNLLSVYQSPQLGTLCESPPPEDPEKLRNSHDLMGQSAIFIENSQSLETSIEILPHYS